MKKNHLFTIIGKSIVILSTIFLIISCGGGGGGNGSGSDKAEEILDKAQQLMKDYPRIEELAKQLGFPINKGKTPPFIEGLYETEGEIENASLYGLIGTLILSDVCLSNQEGREIDYMETLSNGEEVIASGEFLTGSLGMFTMWQEIKTDCGLHNVILISGKLLENGDIDIQTLTLNLNTKKINCNNAPGYWYYSTGIFKFIVYSCEAPPQEETETYYRDEDGDGYGDWEDFIKDTNQPPGYVKNSQDCDDGNAAINPGAIEEYDGVDNNCDGDIDEGFDDPCDKTSYWEDGDIDGFGNPNTLVEACEQPFGYVTNSEDCNDADETINPDAIEECDDIDNNCDGETDEEFDNLCQKQSILMAVQDAYVSIDQPETNFGSENLLITTAMELHGNPPSPSFIWFDFSGIPNDAEIIKAELQITGILHLQEVLADIYVYRMNSFPHQPLWVEDEIIFLNKPWLDGDSILFENVDFSDKVNKFDITRFATSWLAGEVNYGIKVVSYLTIGNSAIFYSREFGDGIHSPRLIVTYK